MRGCAGGLLKESPTPPRTFLERIIIGGSRRSRPVPAFACAPAWRHGLSLPLWRPRGGLPRAALARPAPGERTISNAEVPLPRSPLSLAAGSAYREPLPVVFALNRRLSVAPGTCLAGSVSAAGGKPPLSFPQRQGEPVPPGFSPGDARGEAPCIRKLKISPFPPGRGLGGWGQ